MLNLLRTTTVSCSSLFLVFLLVWPGTIAGGPQDGNTDGLTLSEAISMALRDNPALDAARVGRQVTEAGLAEAESARLPHLRFSETYSHGNNPVFVFGSLLEQSRFGPTNFATDSLNSPGSLSNFRSSLEFQLPIFNRFRISSGIKTARIEDQKARILQVMVEQQLRYRVLETYFGVPVALNRRAVAEEAVGTVESELRRIRDLYSQGMVVASDRLAMEVQLAKYQQQLARARADVKVAYAALSVALGQPIDVGVDLTDELDDRTFPSPGVDQLMGQALAARPDFQLSELEIQQIQEETRAASGELWPDLNLFANYGQSSRRLTDGSADYSIGARLTFNILDFGRRHRIDRARAAGRSAEARRQAMADEIRLEVIRAHEDLQAAVQQLAFAAGATGQAEEAVRIVRDRYQVGLTTVTEMLRSQTALIEARLNQLVSRYHLYLGYGRLLLASGKLNDLVEFSRSVANSGGQRP